MKNISIFIAVLLLQTTESKLDLLTGKDDLLIQLGDAGCFPKEFGDKLKETIGICLAKFEKKEIKSSSSCKSEALLSLVLGDIHNRFGVSKCVLEKIGHMKQERKVVDGEVMIESKFDDAAILKDIQKWKKIRDYIETDKIKECVEKKKTALKGERIHICLHSLTTKTKRIINNQFTNLANYVCYMNYFDKACIEYRTNDIFT